MLATALPRGLGSGWQTNEHVARLQVLHCKKACEGGEAK